MVRLPRCLSEALYSLQLRMRYVAFFFIARKAYHVTASATLHSDSCNKALLLLNLSPFLNGQGKHVNFVFDLGQIIRFHTQISGIKVININVRDWLGNRRSRHRFPPRANPETSRRCAQESSRDCSVKEWRRSEHANR